MKEISFEEFQKKLDEFEKNLKREVRLATDRVGLLGADEIIKGIDARKVPPGADSSDYPNAPRTIAMKGTDVPLVGEDNDLRRSITNETQDWKTAIVGVLKNEEATNIGVIVHEGATIPVTAKMRAYMASIGFPIAKDTKVIRIPARPFLRHALNRDIVRKYKVEWNNAVQRALS